MAANISWYMQKTMEGIRLLATDGDSRTPLSAKYSRRSNNQGVWVGGNLSKKSVLRSPMKGPALSLNVKENPQKNHCIHL